jgi:hypothetical protein
MIKELLDKILIYNSVCRALKHSQKKNALLSVYKQNLVSLVPVKTGYLSRGDTNKRSVGAYEADLFIAPRLIYKDKVI